MAPCLLPQNFRSQSDSLRNLSGVIWTILAYLRSLIQPFGCCQKQIQDPVCKSHWSWVFTGLTKDKPENEFCRDHCIASPQTTTQFFHTAFKIIIIHQTHYEKSDWSRAFNQFTIACELDMINAISAADIAFIMSSSTSAWLPSPLECSPQKQNGWTLRFCFWGWIMSINKDFSILMYTLFRQRFYYCILKFLNDLG